MQIDRLIGWGDDPAFNLWTFEHNWAAFSKLGIFSWLRSNFWDAGIFWPQHLTLTLSENQIFSSLASYPLYRLLGNPIQTLNLFLIVVAVLNFVFAGLWLQNHAPSKRWAWFGALLFASNGWWTTHVAHYQNIPIFLIPLFLWIWDRFNQSPTFLLAVVAGVFEGWAAGWNLYFQIFLNLILASLLYLQFRDRRELSFWKYAAILGVVAGFTQWILLRRYIELQSLLGSFSAPPAETNAFGAWARSPLLQVNYKTLLPSLAPWAYAQTGGIEATGFLGWTWLLAVLAGFFHKRAKAWVLLCLVIFWLSLGPRGGLWWILTPFPGFGSLRAIGRLQILLVLFSIPALLEVLAQARFKRFWWALPTLILLEICPAQPFLKKELQVDTVEWSSSIKSPVLQLPQTDSETQLLLGRAGILQVSGYSGRSFPNAFDLGRQFQGHPEQLDLFASWAGAKSVIFFGDSKPVTKYPTQEVTMGAAARRAWVIDLSGAPALPKWSFQVDLEPRETLDPKTGYRVDFVTSKNGLPDYAEMGQCHMSHQYFFAGHKVLSKDRPVPPLNFDIFERQSGGTVFTHTENSGMTRLSQWLPITLHSKIICSRHSYAHTPEAR